MFRNTKIKGIFLTLVNFINYSGLSNTENFFPFCPLFLDSTLGRKKLRKLS